MNPLRLIPFAFALAASVCLAQLPPSLIKPGQPIAPAPVVPSPAAPVVPAVPDSPEAPTPGLPNTLTPDEQAQGWKLLFDGKRLYGVRGLQKPDPLSAGWKIQDGELNLPKEVKDTDRITGGDIVTLDFYWDFDFRFEWKTTVAANSGVRYMLVERVGEVPVGLEYQIIDDVHNSISLRGGPLRRSGSLDNILPVGANAKLRVADPLNRVGDPWNEGRIVVQGTHVEHWMNGEKVLEFELGPQIRKLAVANLMQGNTKMKTAAERTVPLTLGIKSKTRIALADQGTEIAFRNLKIRTLAPQAMVIPGAGTPRPGGTVPNPLLIPPSR
jgi:hypothetical protein